MRTPTDDEDPSEMAYSSTDLLEEYVDFSSLHPDRARDLLRNAKNNYEITEIEFNNTVGRQGRQSPQNPKEEAYWRGNPFFIKKAMDLMQQSVFATRTRLRETIPLRKKLTHRIEYGAALMYGAMMQMRIKMDNLYATMKKFDPWKTKFLWYLVLYERCLSFNVDIEQMVQEMFQLQTRFHEGLAMEEDDNQDGPTHRP